MSTKPLRILVSGDVEGNFDQLFSRINSIQKKSGNFDLLMCVGDFFGNDESKWQPYKSGEKKVPVSTLILGPNKTEHTGYYQGNDGADMCDNVTYLELCPLITDNALRLESICQLYQLYPCVIPSFRNAELSALVGKRGIFTGSSGLQLAYLSGLESSADTSDDTHFCDKDVSALTLPVISDTKFKGVDILITSQWPRGVDKYATELKSLDCQSCGSASISQLALHLKPRYHFAGLQSEFYERQPYRNHKVLAEKERHVTRFIGMANVSNKDKKKYLYAFNITPMSSMESSELTKQPTDVTECPYKLTMSRQALQEQQEEKSTQFFYDMNTKDKGRKRQNDGDSQQDRKKERKHPKPTGPCWFCLGSPEVEKHLVVSVGTQNYLALAKGGLVPDHILILPIGHHQSTVTAPADVTSEVDKYKLAVKKYFKSQGKSVVFFERNYKTQHLQIQVIPIPTDCLQEVKETFMECAESESFELHEIPKHSDIKQIVPPGAPYFYAELPTGDKLLHRISKHFPLQFGRDVLASPQLLNMTDRVDWRNCKISKEEETAHAQDFKSSFKHYDFTLM